MTTGLTRQAVEDFLYHEAALLDQGKLDEWVGWLTADCVHRVSNGMRESEPAVVDDDYAGIRARVARLRESRGQAHRRTRRMLSNVRIVDRRGDEIFVECNFVAYRFGPGEPAAPWVGRYRYKLRLVEGIVKIAAREAIVDDEAPGTAGVGDLLL